MIPFLTYPLALIGFVAVPMLLGIYFLRRKFRTRLVSSLLLWGVAGRAAEGGKRVKRIEWPLLLLLELLILLFLVVAAVDPRWSLARPRRRLIVVLEILTEREIRRKREVMGSSGGFFREEMLTGKPVFELAR